MGIESNGADSVVAQELLRFGCTSNGGFRALVILEATEGIVCKPGGFPLFRLSQSLPLAVEDEFGVFDEWHALRAGELFSSCTDKIYVRTIFEHEARGLDWIAQALNACNATGLHAATVHQKSVELNAAVSGEKASPSRIEGRVVFHHGDSGFNCIDRCPTPRQNSIAGFESFAHTRFVRLSGIVWNGPCATVNDQDRLTYGSSHPLMLVD